MKAHILMDAIGNVSDKLIIDAEIAWRKKQRHGLKFIMISAACIILSMSMIIGGIILNRDFSMGDPQLTPPNNIPSDGTEGGGTPSTPSEGNGDITPDEPLSDVLEFGYVYDIGSGGSSTPPLLGAIDIACKINRVIDLSKETFDLTLAYGFYNNPYSDPADGDPPREFDTVTHMFIRQRDTNEILKIITVEDLMAMEPYCKTKTTFDEKGEFLYYTCYFNIEEVFTLNTDVFLAGEDEPWDSIDFKNIVIDFEFYENGSLRPSLTSSFRIRYTIENGNVIIYKAFRCNY